MADFWQHGPISVLQRRWDRSVEDLEKEIVSISSRRKIVLLLSAPFSEFDTPAMLNIIAELKDVNYLHAVILSLDNANAYEFKKARKIMANFTCPAKVIWHDGPRMQMLYQELHQNDVRLTHPGSGQSFWITLGYILSGRDVRVIATHDCGIVNYKRETLARLVYPVVHPAIDFEFSKGYYARFADRPCGMVARLFYTPIIRTLGRILGEPPFLYYLDNFRYALSGEFAMTDSLAMEIRISPTWGFEVSLLSEICRRASVNRICQFEIAEDYEHKHHVPERQRPNAGPIRMAYDIAKALFRILSQDGVVLSDSFFRTLIASYIQEARFSIEKYHALSLINGFSYDRQSEIKVVETFVDSLRSAVSEFAEDPVGIPMLPAWARVTTAIPDFQVRLSDCVESDNLAG